MIPNKYTLLKTLEEKATAGPWSHWYEGSGDYLVSSTKGEEICSVFRPDAHFMGLGPGADINEIHAKLIAEARNQVPNLLKDLEIALEALEKVAQHDNDRWMIMGKGEMERMERQPSPQEYAQTALDQILSNKGEN